MLLRGVVVLEANFAPASATADGAPGGLIAGAGGMGDWRGEGMASSESEEDEDDPAVRSSGGGRPHAVHFLAVRLLMSVQREQV